MFIVNVHRDGVLYSRYELDKAGICIGSDPGAEVLLQDPEVCPWHAGLGVDPDGSMYVLDLSSVGRGIQVDGEWVDNRAEVLEHQPVRIGPFTLFIQEITRPDAKLPELPPRPLDDRESGFLHAIHELFDDDEPRLVYGDWLMERGDPRGDFIALQCAGAAAEGADAASAETMEAEILTLLTRHASRWFDAIIPTAEIHPRVTLDVAVLSWRGAEAALRPLQISRGFLAHPLCVSADHFRHEGGRLFRISPTLYVIDDLAGEDGAHYIRRARVYGAAGKSSPVAVKHSRHAPELGTSGGFRHDQRLHGHRESSKEIALGRLVAHDHVQRYLGPAYWGIMGDLAVVTEWLDGLDLNRLMDRIQRLAPATVGALAANVGCAVCAALDHIHGVVAADGQPADIVHGEVSPRHIVMTRDGGVKLCNLGRASARVSLLPSPETQSHQQSTDLGSALANKGWRSLSPEAVDGRDTDRRSDLFGLGSVLYEMVCGRHPFVATGDSIFTIVQAVRHCRPPRLATIANVPAELERVIERAMACDPEDRYPHARAMQRDLEAVIAAQRWPSGLDFLAETLAAIEAAPGVP